MPIGRSIAEKALKDLKAARAAKSDLKLPLEEWLTVLGKSIEAGIASHMPEITGEPILSKLSAPQRKALFDAMVESCAYNPDEITRAKGAEINTAIRDIRLVTPELKPEDISGRASSFKLKHKDWILTPTALAKWWSDLSPPKPVQDFMLEPPNGWRDILAELAGELYRDVPWTNIRSEYGRRIWAKIAN